MTPNRGAAPLASPSAGAGAGAGWGTGAGWGSGSFEQPAASPNYSQQQYGNQLYDSQQQGDDYPQSADALANNEDNADGGSGSGGGGGGPAGGFSPSPQRLQRTQNEELGIHSAEHQLLDLSRQSLPELDAQLPNYAFANLRVLVLHDAGLTSLPIALPASLHKLDVARNKLPRIAGVEHLTQLRVFVADFNEVRRTGFNSRLSRTLFFSADSCAGGLGSLSAAARAATGGESDPHGDQHRYAIAAFLHLLLQIH